jgi:DNA-binding CsgD family transcriptional regulator
MEKVTLTTGMEIFSEIEWIELVSYLHIYQSQTQLIRFILSGQSENQIAIEMRILVAGVRAHLNRLFSKFELQDRYELVLYIFNSFRKGCRANGCPCYR